MTHVQHTFTLAATLLGATVLLAACGSKQKTHTLSMEEAEKHLLTAEVYTCDEGTEIRAAYPDFDTAVIEYNGTAYVLENAVSADGSRYINERIEWWVKGAGENAKATLFRHKPNGTGTALENNCRIR